MMMLDRAPCHGYELRRQLIPTVGDVEITKLYRILRDMEKEGLVNSEEFKGPHGPKRRVYTVGPTGERRLQTMLGEAIGVVLHFYDAFRHFSMIEEFGKAESMQFEVPDGKVLVSILSPLMYRETGTVQILEQWGETRPLHVLGDSGIWEQKKAKFERVEGLPWNVSSKSTQFKEFWILGTPPRSLLPRTIMEAKRILEPEGILRMIAPFAFFDEPSAPSLESFIRVSATHRFPELGVVEGQEICNVFEQLFEKWGTIKFRPGMVEFWGMKQPAD
ncbi:MAG: helix-turn-helix transcriptional regulator [Candidatus Thorarchaeota archaeon]|nr:MAG: helix-turn-helix transcriptional regulator [Candidatus Thorarchaeota archaeon]